MPPQTRRTIRSLSDRLRAWASHWAEHHHWDTGWDDPRAAEYSQNEGDELLDARRTHAAPTSRPFADVIDEL